MVAAAFDNLARSRRQAKLEQELRRAKSEIDQLNEIGIALSTQRDRESLLNLILQKSCDITDSDAGSLYLVEENDQGAKQLRFKTTQNNSMRLYLGESLLPLDRASLAGYVASTGDEVHLADVYQIPSSYPFTFNRKFDDESGYRSKSMLVVPMKDPRGEILGVIQLINCKRDPGAPWADQRPRQTWFLSLKNAAHCSDLWRVRRPSRSKTFGSIKASKRCSKVSSERR